MLSTYPSSTQDLGVGCNPRTTTEPWHLPRLNSRLDGNTARGALLFVIDGGSARSTPTAPLTHRRDLTVPLPPVGDYPLGTLLPRFNLLDLLGSCLFWAGVVINLLDLLGSCLFWAGVVINLLDHAWGLVSSGQVS